MREIKITKLTFNPERTECWIVLKDGVGDYIGTLHTRHKELIDMIISENPTKVFFEKEGK